MTETHTMKNKIIRRVQADKNLMGCCLIFVNSDNIWKHKYLKTFSRTKLLSTSFHKIFAYIMNVCDLLSAVVMVWVLENYLNTVKTLTI